MVYSIFLLCLTKLLITPYDDKSSIGDSDSSIRIHQEAFDSTLSCIEKRPILGFPSCVL